MANIVINTGITDPRITSCKVYRSYNPQELYNASNLIGTTSGQNIGTFTDTVTRDQTKSHVYYGFECITAQGNSVKSPPRGVLNTFDAPSFFGADYPSCFRTGSVAHGILLEDPAGTSIPLRSEIRTWFNSKVLPLSTSISTVPESGFNQVIAYNGEFLIWGSSFVTLSGNATVQCATIKTVLDAVAANPEEFTITRDGFKWRLDVLTEDELSSTGVWVRGSNNLNPGVYSESASLNYLMAGLPRDENTYVTVQNSTSRLKPNNFFDYEVATGTAGVGSSYPALALRYVGQV